MISQNSNTNTILVSINSLLDTRLGTLIKINPDFAFNVTSSSPYYNRVIDVFEDEEYGRLDIELYNKVYETFKESIVRNSLKTKLTSFLFELCNKLVMKAIDGPIKSMVSIDVNLHPYKFTVEESKELIKTISESLNNQFIVNYVNISTENLTCDLVNNQYSSLIMYNYGDWFNYHTSRLRTRILKEIVLYAPRLNFVRELTDEEKNLFKYKDMDEFGLTEMLLCDFIKLQYLPVNLFCADTPANIIV